jgi:hypothetical protein
MIKLFRNIRKKLLAEGKTSKYFKYAIGEIFLVVIGILIALQINDWNEHRKNQTLEKRYIAELRSDLQKDSIAIQDMIKTSNLQVRSKRLLFMFLEKHSDYKIAEDLKPMVKNIIYNEQMVSDSIATHFNKQWQPTYNFAPNKTTLDEMTSTGNIGLISNRELRRAVLETYNQYERHKLRQESMYRKQQEEMWNLVYAEVPNMYSVKSSDLPQIFEDHEVINRFEGNYAVFMNDGLYDLQTTKQHLLDQLNEYQKEN